MTIAANPKRDRMKTHEHYLLPCKLSELVIMPFLKVPFKQPPRRPPGKCLISSYAPNAIKTYNLANGAWNYADPTPEFISAYQDILHLGDVNDPQWGLSVIELYDWKDDQVGATVGSHNCIASRVLCVLLPEDTK